MLCALRVVVVGDISDVGMGSTVIGAASKRECEVDAGEPEDRHLAERAPSTPSARRSVLPSVGATAVDTAQIKDIAMRCGKTWHVYVREALPPTLCMSLTRKSALWHARMRFACMVVGCTRLRSASTSRTSSRGLNVVVARRQTALG